ncbi:hypothetical protein PG989_011937 [Apiospora arundinis]
MRESAREQGVELDRPRLFAGPPPSFFVFVRRRRGSDEEPLLQADVASDHVSPGGAHALEEEQVPMSSTSSQFESTACRAIACGCAVVLWRSEAAY